MACLGTLNVVLKHIFAFQCNDWLNGSYMFHIVELLAFESLRKNVLHVSLMSMQKFETSFLMSLSPKLMLFKFRNA